MGSKGANGVSQTNGNLTNGDSHPSKDTQHSRSQSSYSAKFNLAAHFIGGNHLEAAPSGRVKDFVANNDGHTVITNVSFRL